MGAETTARPDWAFENRRLLATVLLDYPHAICASPEEVLDHIHEKLRARNGLSLDNLLMATRDVLNYCSRAPIGDRPLRTVMLLEIMFEYLQQRAGMTFQQVCCAIHEWREQYL